MITRNDIWDQVTTTLQSHLPETDLATWFAATALRDCSPQTAVVEVPNKFIADWLQDHYLRPLRDAFQDVLGASPAIRFVARAGPPVSIATRRTPNASQALNPTWTFGDFVTADSNRFAFHSARSVAEKPGECYNPFVLFSPLSAGKSHLLHAIGNHLRGSRPAVQFHCLSAADFAADFAARRRENRAGPALAAYGHMGALLFDDLQGLETRKKTQEEFISLFDFFYQKNLQIAIASKLPPSQIHGLNPRLRSRLEWGLLAEIQTPDRDTKTTILTERARKAQIPLSEEVVAFLAASSNDLKSLEQYVVALQALTSLLGRGVDLAMAESIVRRRVGKTADTGQIQRITAKYFGISTVDLVSEKKARRFSYPRQVAMYFCRQVTPLSYKNIGRAFGNKDHSTVIYAIRRIEQQRKTHPEVLGDLMKIHGQLPAGIPMG